MKEMRNAVLRHVSHTVSLGYPRFDQASMNREIHTDFIVYIFAHLHTTLHTEENVLGTY